MSLLLFGRFCSDHSSARGSPFWRIFTCHIGLPSGIHRHTQEGRFFNPLMQNKTCMWKWTAALLSTVCIPFWSIHFSDGLDYLMFWFIDWTMFKVAVVDLIINWFYLLLQEGHPYLMQRSVQDPQTSAVAALSLVQREQTISILLHFCLNFFNLLGVCLVFCRPFSLLKICREISNNYP